MSRGRDAGTPASWSDHICELPCVENDPNEDEASCFGDAIVESGAGWFGLTQEIDGILRSLRGHRLPGAILMSDMTTSNVTGAELANNAILRHGFRGSRKGFTGAIRTVIDVRPTPGSDVRHGMARYCKRATVPAIAALLLAGCTGLFGEMAPTPTTSGPIPAAELSPLMAFIAAAQQGQTATLRDPGTGANVEILAGRPYNAASGRRCRPFFVVSGPAYLGRTEGLACEADPGRWALSELTVNPENLDR